MKVAILVKREHDGGYIWRRETHILGVYTSPRLAFKALTERVARNYCGDVYELQIRTTDQVSGLPPDVTISVRPEYVEPVSGEPLCSTTEHPLTGPDKVTWLARDTDVSAIVSKAME